MISPFRVYHRSSHRGMVDKTSSQTEDEHYLEDLFSNDYLENSESEGLEEERRVEYQGLVSEL